MEFRCPSRINAELDGNVLKVKCPSKHCGAGNGTSVFHYYDILSGERIETKRFQDPQNLLNKKEEESNAHRVFPAAVRHS